MPETLLAVTSKCQFLGKGDAVSATHGSVAGIKQSLSNGQHKGTPTVKHKHTTSTKSRMPIAYCIARQRSAILCCCSKVLRRESLSSWASSSFSFECRSSQRNIMFSCSWRWSSSSYSRSSSLLHHEGK